MICIKVRIERTVHTGHPLQAGTAQEVQLIRHVGNAPFYRRIVPDWLTVDQHLAPVRLVNTGHRPQKRGLSGTIRANHAVDAPCANGTGDILQRRKILKPLGQILNLNHVPHLPRRRTQSPAPHRKTPVPRRH